ncbi:hypothetical protein MUP95_01800 [bacterium]|nr:hypothetical protein [bacterium]
MIHEWAKVLSEEYENGMVRIQFRTTPQYVNRINKWIEKMDGTANTYL